VKVERQAVQVAEELAAHIRHDARADKGHDHDALPVAEPFAQRRRAVEQRPVAQAAQVAGAQPVINRLADNPRPRHGEQRRRHHPQHRRQHTQPVGPDEFEQALHQPLVIAAPDGLVFGLAQQRLDLFLAALAFLR
jgi:hypothetical protein